MTKIKEIPFGKSSIFVRAKNNDTKAYYDEQIVNEVWIQYRHYLDQLQEINVIVDIGGHIGSFTKMVQQINENVKSFAVEPFSWELFKKNTNIEPYKGFIAYPSSKEGVSQVYMLEINKNNLAANRIVIKENFKPSKNTLWLPQNPITLSDFVNKNYPEGNIDVLKIDAEGIEWDIFRNEKQDFFERFSLIIGEWHFWEKKTEENFLSLAKSKLPNFELLHYDDVPDWGIFAFKKKS